MGLLLLVIWAIGFWENPSVDKGGGEPGETVSERLRLHTQYLGDDARSGRGTGTPGEEQSAAYIQKQLEASGLEPLGDNGTFFQKIPMHGSRALPESRLLLYDGNRRLALTLEKDYVLFQNGAGTVVPSPVRLVFVGYGIVAPEYDYNDYQHVDVSGAVVVMLDGEPHSGTESYFDGHRPTVYSLPEMKQRLAASRGAKGTLIIPRMIGAQDWAYWQNVFAFEHVGLPYEPSSHFNALLNPEAARHFLSGSGYQLTDIYTLEQRHEMRSFPLEKQLTFEGRFVERDFRGINVIGLLPGANGDIDEYVLVAAHYDHLGVGPKHRGDGVYNGVVDNALGCAGVLEMARALASGRIHLKRSIVFLFVTGEEKGLLGSRYYCENPAVPLHRTIAAVNVDGLAIYDSFKEVIGVGARLSTLGNHLEEVAQKLGLEMGTIPLEFGPDLAFSRSDQLSFAQAGIPAILISEGFNYHHLSREEGKQKFMAWGEVIYHSPFDDLNQPLNFDAASYHLGVITRLVTTLANTDRKPEWLVGGRYRAARLKSIARGE